MTQPELVAAILDEAAAFPTITEELALEAYTFALATIRNRYDAAHYFACMNLLNTYVKHDEAGREFAKNYAFKLYVARAIDHVIEESTKGVAVYIGDDVIYAKVLGFQFSFHNVRLTSAMLSYKASADNVVQEWRGVRLQPPAALIMPWTREVRATKGEVLRRDPVVECVRVGSIDQLSPPSAPGSSTSTTSCSASPASHIAQT